MTQARSVIGPRQIAILGVGVGMIAVGVLGLLGAI